MRKPRSRREACFLPEWQAYLRYMDFPGDEPVCVYLSGLGGAATAAYPEVIAHRALNSRRSLLVDWLGWGYSDRPAQCRYRIEDHAASVEALLDQLHLKGCVLIAHSMGGPPAIILANTRPDLVSQLVLAEANLDAGGGTVSRSVASQSETEYVTSGYRAFIENLRTEALNGNKAMALLAGLWQVADPLALHRTAVSLVAGGTPSWREQLYRLTIPRLYVIGELSLPDEDAERLPANGVPVAIMPGVGHLMMIMDPAGFAKILGTVLKD